MPAALFHSPIVFTAKRTQFPVSISISKYVSVESSPCLHCHQNFRSKGRKQSKGLLQVKATVADGTQSVSKTTEKKEFDVNQALQKKKKELRILVAGGGIGGLVFALAAKRKGFDVVVFEKDLSTIRGEGQYRGPIQIQSNALAALEAIDLEVAEEIMEAACITGDRINGLVDGVSGTWYIKFDTFTPAAERGLPVTRVISRMTLQEILASTVGEDIIFNESNVVDFEDDGNKVTVVLENGKRYEGDLLVGADGIWSKVRTKLFGPTDAVYSGYTCYTGIADFVPADIESVGYRIFLGHKQYFVSADVGAGKMQWYAFHKEPPDGVDTNGKKERLLQIFDNWCDNVIDLLLATDEEAILRRDVYDRTPSLTWGRGRVTLLGDSIHAMQPNMGQGGCMAIEDSYQLALELDKAWNRSVESGTAVDIVSSLKSYERARRLRVAIIHGMARMAASMASAYKGFLGVGLGPLSFLTKFRIPHPGTVAVRFFIDLAMSLMLNWVLGGNSSELEGRSLSCRLSDKASDQFRTWFEDNDALERTINGDWFLLPVGNGVVASQPTCLSRDENRTFMIGSEGSNKFPETSIVIPSKQVSKMHAQITYKDGALFMVDLQSEHGTFIDSHGGRRSRVPPNVSIRLRPSDVIEFGSDKKAALRVKVMRSHPKMVEKEGGGILQAV
ncbi:hypothetical protein GQ457_05G007140 [Hibiscus cannabinus]